MTSRALAVVLLAAAAACRPSAPPAGQGSTATPTATPTATDTAPPIPPPPVPPPIRAALAREPAGTTALTATGESVVDSAATFEVELEPRLADARLVLLDAADAHVPAQDVREIGATTRLTLAPEKPLVPAARYVLRADGAASREMHDADGRAYAAVAFAILVAGDPPPPEPAKPPRKHRRR
jgi:hypothetical protein